MNWVGGSRSRIRTQNERKLQREFFERKKFADKVQVYRSIGGTGIRKHGLGQDFRAFQTVNVAHSHHTGCDITSRPVKKVDLDVFKPAFSRMVEDINLGPVSPTSSVSKISLNEPKYETKEANGFSSFVKPENQIDMKTSKSSVKFEPYSSPNPYKFKKPEPKLKFQFTDYDRSFPRKFQHNDLEPETPRLESFHEPYMSEKNIFKYSLFNTDNQQNINQNKHLLDRKNKNLHKDSSNDLSIAQLDKSLSSQRSSNGLNVKFCDRTTEIHVPSNYSRSKHKRAFEKYDKNISQKSSAKSMFVSEDFQITPLRKYQQESESPQRPSNTQEGHQSSLNNKSPIDIHNRIFSSSDFIETPLKRRKFTFPHSTSQLYPKTSTPLPKMSTKASPDVGRMLTKQLQIPDIVEDQNISSLLLARPGGLKLYHFQDHKDTVACSEALGNSRTSDDLENCSPCEATVFPDDQVRDYRIENTDKCRLDRDLIGMKIGLRRSPEELSDTVHQGKEGEENIKRKGSTDSQMAEVLEELTELEKQDGSEDVFDIEEALINGEENDVCKNESLEKKNIEKAKKTTEILSLTADGKQEKVNKEIVTKILKELVSRVQDDAGNEIMDNSFEASTVPAFICNTSKNKCGKLSEYSSDEEFSFTPIDLLNTGITNISNSKAVMHASETQTDFREYIDTSTSPMPVSYYTEDKSVQCSVSRGVSPNFMESSCQSIPSDLIVRPLKSCNVRLDRLEISLLDTEKQDEINIQEDYVLNIEKQNANNGLEDNIWNDMKSDTYCLRSRKGQKIPD